jgi:ppGpp synthetase/RelA/SpoT-type nucleotidyltranferase
MKLTYEQRKVNDWNRQIERMKEYLQLLNRDLLLVKSESVKEFISNEIERIKRRIDHKEFELWKLSRENNSQ